MPHMNSTDPPPEFFLLYDTPQSTAAGGHLVCVCVCVTWTGALLNRRAFGLWDRQTQTTHSRSQGLGSTCRVLYDDSGACDIMMEDGSTVPLLRRRVADVTGLISCLDKCNHQPIGSKISTSRCSAGAYVYVQRQARMLGKQSHFTFTIAGDDGRRTTMSAALRFWTELSRARCR